jgi:2-aminoadipate transaminase
MKMRFADRVEFIQPSPIRELLKLTQQPGVISFAGGLPAPESFPIEAMKSVSQKVLEESGPAAMQYSTTEGVPALRRFIAGRMRQQGMAVDEINILITCGSQQGLDFTGKLFINEGDVVICESPSYIGALNAFRSYCPIFAEVETDEDGMIPAVLEETLKQYPEAKFIYLIPDFQNPTGRCISLQRRAEIVEMAAQYQVPVIEDNPYGELRFEGEKLPSLKHFDMNGNVIYLGTFSKTFCPGLRIGWVAAAEDVIRKYVLVKQSADLQTNTMTQLELVKFVELYDFDDHVALVTDIYHKRRDAMLGTMAVEFPEKLRYTRPNGGMFTWVEMPLEMDASVLLSRALQQKVAFVPGSSFYPNGGHENTFRLNYGTMPEQKIVEGIRRLAAVLKEYVK